MTELDRWLDRVHCGDCLDVLRELPDCSVDLCATDPPYALTSGTGAKGGFMGKAWDAALPARAIWAEVLRVLKPGASCFVCAGARQDTLLGMLTDLREVGFDIQHAALSWVYFTGFPKSTNVGKDIDKAAFLAWLRETPEGETATRQELMGWGAEEVRKAASAAVNGCAPDSRPIGADATYNGGNGAWHSSYSHGTRLLAALQARFGDAPGVRAKVGVGGRTGGGRTCMSGTPEGGRARDTLPGEYNSTSPSTPEAVQWDGWHSGSCPLKPMTEHILWVTKPSEPGPARNNVKRWGTGACNIGECRVPTDDEWAGGECNSGPGTSLHGSIDGTLNEVRSSSHPSGRYPANLLVTARALGDDSKYGDIDEWAAKHGISEEWLELATEAGVLQVPKPSRSEKNAGCEGLEERENPQQYGSIQDARPHAPDGYKYDRKPSRNSHATVKPLTLMAFICVLACPRGGVVLDPFLGSGTTGVAAVSCGMHYIGIEREPEYVAIAEARIAAALRNKQPALAL